MVHHLKRGKALRLNAGPDRPCLCCQPVEPASRHERCEEGPRPTGDGGRGGRGPPVLPSVQRLGSRRERRGQGEAHATDRVPCASSMVHTGEPARDGKESGEEAGETRTASSEALQGVRGGRGVGVWESHRQGEGPEGEGRETGQRSPGNVQAVHHGGGGILAQWTSPYLPSLVSRVR